MSKRAAKADDPLIRACPACGARAREGCRTVAQLPLVPRAARLVHADRLEERTTDA